MPSVVLRASSTALGEDVKVFVRRKSSAVSVGSVAVDMGGSFRRFTMVYLYKYLSCEPRMSTPRYSGPVGRCGSVPMIADTRSRNCLEKAGIGRRGVGSPECAKGGALSLDEIDLIDGRNFVAGVPHQWFAELRREAPVFWHPEAIAPRGGFWAITRYDDCVHVNRDWEHFSSARRGCPLPRDGRRPAGPAAADDGQHGPDHAHPLPATGQQGLHPQDGAGPGAADHRVRRRHHRRRLRARHAPTSSRRSPPSSRSSSSPSCSACPRRTAAWSSTGPTA